MAKVIKYQLATEYPHDVIVQVPLLDEDGNQVMEEILVPGGFDESGEPIMETVSLPVFTNEVRQETEIIFTDVAIRCETDETLQANLPIAEREAYNGEYTVEEVAND